jgi:hypothetical protein
VLTRLAIGIVAALILEFINGVFTFMLPPLIIITPVCLAVAAVAAARVHSSRKNAGL